MKKLSRHQRRDIALARAGLRRFGLHWTKHTTWFTGSRYYTLDTKAGVTAEARDYGLMSYFIVTVDGRELRPRADPEETAWSVEHVMVRATLQVIGILEERAATVATVLAAS